MSWKMFLDDRREVHEEGWEVVRTVKDAIEALRTKGVPEVISFDYDLTCADYGDYEQAYATAFVTWLREHGVREFDWAVHTGSPSGETILRSSLFQLTQRQGVKAPSCSL